VSTLAKDEIEKKKRRIENTEALNRARVDFKVSAR
jgi:hypothetical protein